MTEYVLGNLKSANDFADDIGVAHTAIRYDTFRVIALKSLAPLYHMT